MTNHLFDAMLAGRLTDERPFLKLADGRIWSYAEILALTGRMANALRDLGARRDDRVAVLVEKSPEALALYFACLRAGIVFIPLNTAFTRTELDYYIDDAEPAVVVCDARRRDDLAAVAERRGAVLVTLNGDGGGELAERAEGAPADFDTTPRAAGDLAATLYTSGTTGRSKGAMLSHANLLSNAEALAAAWRFTENDVLLHGLPIFHTHGLFVATNVMAMVGGSMIFMAKFDAAEMIRLLPGATVMMGVPTYYTRLLARDDLTREAVAHMRLFISGSAPLLAETQAAFEARTGHRILERYGMTETNMITSNPYDGERRPGSVGFPLPGVEVKIADRESGAAMPRGEIGIIEVRGPNVFSGYWRMPEMTAKELRANGFFITSDLGLIDAEGYVHIVGRAKDLIITGGYNVYPKEVEAEIDTIDGVVESAVFGVPHPDFGEGVVVAVVLATGAALSEEQVVDALDGRLARFKQPKRVLFVEQLPRNVNGKVRKNILRDNNAALFTKT
jgi:malonyl-CoA/methylmalonyl-CoA synthetase